MSKEIFEFVEGIQNEAVLALVWLYIPVLSRWVADAGWDTVRKWLYAYEDNDNQWYIDLLNRMTVEEHREEDERRLAAVKALGADKHMRIEKERMFLRELVNTLITKLISRL